MVDVAYQRYQKSFTVQRPQLFTYSPMPGIYRQVDISRIYFIQSVKDQRRQLQIIGHNLKVQYHGELAKVTSPQLIRVDRSILVNPQNIDHFDAKHRLIYFDPQESISCPCSVRNVTIVKKYLQKRSQ